MSERSTRRAYLLAIGSAGLSSLAGCLGGIRDDVLSSGSGSPTPTDAPDPSTQVTATPTASKTATAVANSPTPRQSTSDAQGPAYLRWTPSTLAGKIGILTHLSVPDLLDVKSTVPEETIRILWGDLREFEETVGLPLDSLSRVVALGATVGVFEGSFSADDLILPPADEEDAEYTETTYEGYDLFQKEKGPLVFVRTDGVLITAPNEKLAQQLIDAGSGERKRLSSQAPDFPAIFTPEMDLSFSFLFRGEEVLGKPWDSVDTATITSWGHGFRLGPAETKLAEGVLFTSSDDVALDPVRAVVEEAEHYAQYSDITVKQDGPVARITGRVATGDFTAPFPTMP